MDLTTKNHRIEVGVRELKNQLSRYIDQACAGTEIIVTEHGKPVARLVPIEETDRRLQELIDAGVVTPPTNPTRHRARARIRTKLPVSDLVDEQRNR